MRWSGPSPGLNLYTKFIKERPLRAEPSLSMRRTICHTGKNAGWITIHSSNYEFAREKNSFQFFKTFSVLQDFIQGLALKQFRTKITKRPFLAFLGPWNITFSTFLGPLLYKWTLLWFQLTVQVGLMPALMFKRYRNVLGMLKSFFSWE